MNAKHQDKHDTEESNDIPPLTKDGLKSPLDRIKQNIINYGYWDKEVTSHIEKIGGNDSLFHTVLPIYTRFCVKRNQDKFLTEFYELIPNSITLFECANQQLHSLVMISMTNHLVALCKCKSSNHHEPSTSKSLDLSEHERGPLS